MQENVQLKIIISGVLLILLIIAGILLHKAGKPYNTLIFAVHKICTIALVIIMVFVLVNYLKITGLPFSFYLVLSLATIALLSLLISGGMMSLDKGEAGMLLIHRLSTAFFLLSYMLLIYFMYLNNH